MPSEAYNTHPMVVAINQDTLHMSYSPVLLLMLLSSLPITAADCCQEDARGKLLHMPSYSVLRSLVSSPTPPGFVSKPSSRLFDRSSARRADP